MQSVVIDASLWLGRINTKDSHHEKAVNFFSELEKKYGSGEVRMLMPAHSVFEVNNKIRHLKNRGSEYWQGVPAFTMPGPQAYPIGQKFIDRVHSEKLHDLFAALRSSDAIYAMIAYLEKAPPYTLSIGILSK